MKVGHTADNKMLIFVIGLSPTIHHLLPLGQNVYHPTYVPLKMVGDEGFEPPRISHLLPKQTRYQVTV